MANESRSAFFYGTLMAPQVLHRVCHGSSSPDNRLYAKHQLKTFPAILHDYRRHRVRSADYPAILPTQGSSVRGTYVTGLNNGDIRLLDLFEGGEYRRDKVKVRLLQEAGLADNSDHVEGDHVEAETYIWQAGEHYLEEGEWDFGAFQREKLSFWAGSGANSEFAEVDEAAAQQQDGTRGRGANGHITTALDEAQKEDKATRDAV